MESLNVFMERSCFVMRIFKVLMTTALMVVALFGMSNTIHAEHWVDVQNKYLVDLDSLGKDYEYMDPQNGWYIAGHAQVYNKATGVSKTWYAQNYNSEGIKGTHNTLYLRMGYDNILRGVTMKDRAEWNVANFILVYFE
jgi:hypothetical protein